VIWLVDAVRINESLNTIPNGGAWAWGGAVVGVGVVALIAVVLVASTSRWLRWPAHVFVWLLVVAVAVTHPKFGQFSVDRGVDIAVLSGVDLALGSGFAAVILSGRRRARDDHAARQRSAQHRVEVWRVEAEGVDFEPYFVARCDCNWVGQPQELSTPGAEGTVRLEAAAHHVNVRQDVVRPLG
jgi:hypothetical protein